MAVSGLALALVVFTLLLKGMGLPLAIALTRVVVTDWIYAWTRNPIVLSALAFLVGLGLWLQSGLFLVWVLVVVSPAMLIFLKVYEERELEIRFGDEYTAYKHRTPMLWPRRPLNRDQE
jgi:protein-S-isoprenylcysteine O-methyltransferase Ste14